MILISIYRRGFTERGDRGGGTLRRGGGVMTK